MGSQQLILVIGGMMLLGTIALTINNSFTSKTDLEIYNEAAMTGAAIGQSVIDRILTRSFDQRTVGRIFRSPDSLTAVGSLGPDTGENNVTLYNDVDDFKNYVKYDTMSVLGVFRTRVDVNYVQTANPEVISSSRTFVKRIDVFVTNQYLGDTLKIFYAVTY